MSTRVVRRQMQDVELNGCALFDYVTGLVGGDLIDAILWIDVEWCLQRCDTDVVPLLFD